MSPQPQINGIDNLGIDGIVNHMNQATATVRSQETCPDCGRLIALYADGTVYFHKQNGRECHGSHKEAK